MRKVHSSRQLFHLFCNMTNADLEGFRTSSRNVYFENGVLYSYGSHYPMARKVSSGTGSNYQEIVLVNSRKSTVTTEKHKSQIRSSARPSQLVFSVPDILTPESFSNESYLLDQIADAVDHVLRGRKYWSISDVDTTVRMFNRYAAAFGFKEFKFDSDFYADLTMLDISNKVRHKTLAETRVQRAEAKLEKQRVALRGEIEAWYQCKNTKPVPSWAFEGLGYDPVRVRGEVVESARGAQVPLGTAEVFCLGLQANAVKVGADLGPFKVEAIDSQFVTIGCHKISINQAISAVLGAV